MTSRYVVGAIRAPHATTDPWGNVDAALSLARVVHQQVDEPIDTGLLNAHGVKLYRIVHRAPIGFPLHAKG